MYTENNNIGISTERAEESVGSQGQGYSYSNGGSFVGNTYRSQDGNISVKPKRKHVFAKVLAVVLCVSLLIGGGAGVALWTTGYFSQRKDEVSLSGEESMPQNLTTITNNQLTATTTAAASGLVTTDVTEIVKESMPSIVAVTGTVTAKYPTMFGQMMEKSGTDAGSGIIVGENETELLIATNYHVIENADSGTIAITFCDEQTASANVKGTDKDMDLAIVAVNKSDISAETMAALKISTLGDSDSLLLGEPVIAIGNGLGYGQSVSLGIVSALSREIQSESGDTNTYIQTDAAINPGNSGGALLNSKGELVGITSVKIADSTVEGMGFAIPVSSAKPILDTLMNEETKVAVNSESRGYLGVRVATPTGVEGAYIVEVTIGGAADRAGLKVGDIITSADREDIGSAEDLTDFIQYCEAGKEISITVLRKGTAGYAEEVLQVTLEKMTSQN